MALTCLLPISSASLHETSFANTVLCSRNRSCGFNRIRQYAAYGLDIASTKFPPLAGFLFSVQLSTLLFDLISVFTKLRILCLVVSPSLLFHAVKVPRAQIT
jgi:hypothetical protein